MRVRLTVEEEQQNIDKLINVLEALRLPIAVEMRETVAPQPESKPEPVAAAAPAAPVVELHSEGNGKEPPKRRGRPPKMAAEPVPEKVSSTPPGNGDDTHRAFRNTVVAFCEEHRLHSAIKTLLSEFQVENVSSVPADRREEFLAEMHNLVPTSSMLR